MIFTMAISLYTSRKILEALGVEDFGLYNVVGGIVAMFGFINASMTASTQRFITFKIGNNDKKGIQDVFGNSILIHLCISVIILVLSETVGLWFVYNKLNIPANRFSAALWTYQASIAMAIAMIMYVPYNAFVIAREKINIFAIISIIEATLKLFIVFVLQYTQYDRLKFFSVLMLSIQIGILIVYAVYCKMTDKWLKHKIIYNKEIFRNMTSFAGWDLYGNFSTIARTQGVNILINIFFGPIVNAAAGIATQVQGAIMNFGTNVIVAVRPQIVKSYSVKNYDRTTFLLFKSGLFTFLLMVTLTAPVIIETEYILKIWLGIVPEYTIEFIRITLLFNLFANLSSVILIGIHATGRIKRPSIINGTLYLSVIPFSYLGYRLGGSPSIAYVFNVFAVFLGMISNAWTLNLVFKEFSFRSFFMQVILKSFIIFLTFIICLTGVKNMLEESYVRLITICLISCCMAVITGLLILSRTERANLYLTIKSKLSK